MRFPTLTTAEAIELIESLLPDRTSAFWLNQVERWFALISQRAIQRGSSDSVPHLVRTIKRFIDDYNETAAPFVWVATADSILQKIKRLSMRICGT